MDYVNLDPELILVAISDRRKASNFQPVEGPLLDRIGEFAKALQSARADLSCVASENARFRTALYRIAHEHRLDLDSSVDDVQRMAAIAKRALADD